jgi:hypothetical protein
VAVESHAQPIEIDNVREEEHHFGGDIVWWTLLLLFSIPVLLWGLALMPDTFGFLVLGIGGIMAGVALAQIIFRLPYFTNSFVRSLILVIILVAVIAGIAFLYNMTLPVPEARLDTTFKPPISGG